MSHERRVFLSTSPSSTPRVMLQTDLLTSSVNSCIESALQLIRPDPLIQETQRYPSHRTSPPLWPYHRRENSPPFFPLPFLLGADPSSWFQPETQGGQGRSTGRVMRVMSARQVTPFRRATRTRSTRRDSGYKMSWIQVNCPSTVSDHAIETARQPAVRLQWNKPGAKPSSLRRRP
jgi:hypothetical protein